MADSTKSVGKLIYDRRTELGITQKEVADFVGVSEATVSSSRTAHQPKASPAASATPPLTSLNRSTYTTQQPCKTVLSKYSKQPFVDKKTMT